MRPRHKAYLLAIPLLAALALAVDAWQAHFHAPHAPHAALRAHVVLESAKLSGNRGVGAH
jgi:hypothetical protein